MKKTMRIAAMLAAAGMMCAVMPVQPASAQIWTLVGSEAETAFQDMIPLDDKGMLNFSGSDASYQVYMQYITDYYDKEVTDPKNGEVKIERVYFDNCRLYVVSPRMNALHFTLRSDKPEAEQQMLEILDQYYPEISTTYQQRVPNDYASLDPCSGVLMDGTIVAPHLYELRDKTEQAGSAVKRNAGTGKISDDVKLVNVPKFVVNLATDDPANTQYARLKISILVENDDKAAEAKKNMDVIRDAVINVMKKKKATDILSNSGSVTALKNELKDGINEELGETLVIQVYVTDLVVQ